MITVITAWYNEEFLANLFLKHYEFADKIIILLDENNSDDTEFVIDKYRNIEVKTLKMPFGMDDGLKQEQINNEYKSIKDGWVIIADADEFIYFVSHDMLSYLEVIDTNDHIIKVDYFQMYQHKTEKRLNIMDPIFDQRKYGIRNGMERWKKPAVARANKNLIWTVGHHEVNTTNIHVPMLIGAHWAMADIDLAIERRIHGRRNRMSPNNYATGRSNHNFNISEDQIKRTCRLYQDCPLVF
jgi:hypothetical protein